jgi:hypothetical protein
MTGRPRQPRLAERTLALPRVDERGCLQETVAVEADRSVVETERLQLT